MRRTKTAKRSQGPHAPVNPLTGMPNEPYAAPAADDAASGEHAAGERPADAREAQDVPSTPPHVSTASTTADAYIASASAATGAAEGPSVSASSTAEAVPSPERPLAGDAPAEDDADPNAELMALLARLLDSCVVAFVMLFLLLLLLVGIEHFVVFACALFVGYVLADRFVNVRRCLNIGGTAWLVVLVCGKLIADSLTGPLVFGIDYLFMFCGFLLATAVCGAYFAGRHMYRHGFEQGQQHADHVIARHLVERLIERPDDWGDLDGDYLEVEAAFNRVRERQRMAEQALRDEASRKDDLVTYLAHDLKTPLASVVGYLSLLQEAPDLPVEQRARFTGIALEKAHRLDALIEEFFDITRFDFHDIVLTRGYVDLNLILSQVAEEFYPTLTEQHKEAKIDVPAGLTVLVDGDKMARVFNNVMKNAIAYSYEGSTIIVSAERVGDTVSIRFENQGDPIPAPKLKVIFEKFYRLDAARATNRGGAGLGLAIAKEIVNAHGGTIACTSSPAATVFTITLPV